jgi:hypothetical protein
VLVAVGLVAHRRQRGADLACFQANDFKARRLQAIGQVLGERAGLEAHRPHVAIEAVQALDDGVNLGGQLASRQTSPLSLTTQIDTDRSDTSIPVW